MSVATPPFASIDDFNRADEATLSGGPGWTGPLRSIDVQLKLASNVIVHPTGTGGQASSYTVKRYIRPFGFSIKLSNASGDAGIDYCIQQPGALDLDGYRYQTNGSVLQLYKISNNGFVKIGGDYAIAAADGDELAITLDYGGEHTLYYKSAAGSWTVVDTVIDTGSIEFIMGYVGLFVTADASVSLDEFKGFQVPSPITFPVPLVTDDFERADANPINTNWDTPTIVGFKNLKLVSGEVAHEDGLTTNGSAWYNVAQYTAPFDVFAKLAVAHDEFGIDYSVVNPGLSTADGFRWQTNAGGPPGSTASRVLQLWRFDNSTFTKIDGDWIIESLAGDQIGVRLLADGTHYLMYNTLNGAWQVVAIHSDSAYLAGFAGLMLDQSTITRLDNFGVGPVTSEAALRQGLSPLRWR